VHRSNCRLGRRAMATPKSSTWLEFSRLGGTFAVPTKANTTACFAANFNVL
jgi:hypothetical protein